MSIEQSTRLRQILEAEGRKQSWLAAQVGIDSGTMNRYLNGLHVPDDRKQRIADALGREIEDVFPSNGRVAA